MSFISKSPAILVLEDGTVFKGKSLGEIGIATGEICFNTGMTGYQEIYTDPSYCGQIIINTSSHIGNYGTINSEQESNNLQINGVIINEYSVVYSRYNATSSLEDYFLKNKTVAICGVDTRKLVKYVRDKGAMNAIISSENLDINLLKQKLKKVPSMINLELSSRVTTKKEYMYGDESAKYKVAVLDLGCKKSILNNFTNRNVVCKVFPAKTSFNKMNKWKPNGFFISNGPGDPASMDYAVDAIKKILDINKPLFGICLGHQLMARACDISTFKLHNGHRGINHPVKNLETGKSEITSQNHGFSVDYNEVDKSKNIKLTHVNLNDNSVEGTKIIGKKAFSVQYHPESAPGPNDSRYLFDNFIRFF
ncbi:MAG TPA: glutamine-hydrolyzing carbamoyl-phosphate synthase small subunit [Cytophagales bacterium]|jgi:carbamoyl-phosphate synthase small subunit|nr:glutamine-hydrolyzing carbamoyl-phosphate synthase small subunit [Cytophagales bacterium]